MNVPVFTIEKCPRLENCVLAYGHFNSVHPGHIRYLKKAASQDQSLLVAIQPDTDKGKNRAYKFSQLERAEGLTVLNIIDGIILLKDEEFSLAKLIKKIKPNFLFLGVEFEESKDPEITEAISMMRKNNKSVQFHAGEIQYASTDLLENSESDIKEENKAKFRTACKRQNIDKRSLIEFVDSFANTKLLVLGDTILDQYAGCEALGMSAEAPVLVVRELQKKNFIGGASIVASHIKALGAQCYFLSVVGNDNNAKIINEELTKQGIICDLIEDSARPTTFKKRYVVENQKLFRVSRLNDNSLSKSIEKKFIDRLLLMIEEIGPINLDSVRYNYFKEILYLILKGNLKICLS